MTGPKSYSMWPATFSVLRSWKLRPSARVFVALEIAAVDADQVVAARANGVGSEYARVAVEIADLADQAHFQPVVGRELQLGTQGDIVVALEILVIGIVEIVDPVVAVLPQARNADRKLVRDFAADGALGIDGRIGAVADACIIAAVCAA